MYQVQKQQLITAIGTTSTAVGIVSGIFGAEYLLAHVYGGGNANALTWGTTAYSWDGVNFVNAPATYILDISTGGSTQNAGFTALIRALTTDGIRQPILYPYLKFFAAIATAGTTPTFDFFPVWAKEHPNQQLIDPSKL